MLVLGVLTIVSSLFSPPNLFLFFIVVGVLLVSFSLFELFQLRKEHPAVNMPSTPAIVQQSDVSYTGGAIASSHTPSKKSFFHLPHHASKKVEDIQVGAITGKKQEQPLTPQKKQDILVIEQATSTNPDPIQRSHLDKFVRDSLQAGQSISSIREAALQAHWPKDIVEAALHHVTVHTKKKQLLVSVGIFVGTLIYLILLQAQDLFLVPYWITLFKFASPLFYAGALLVLVAFSALVGFRIKKTLKRKKVVFQKEEEEHVQEIKTTLASFSGVYETDMDKLYALLQERKTLRVNEIARAFNISKEEAEEWGKIFKEQDLAEIYYPAVGDMEIRWKKSKNTK